MQLFVKSIILGFSIAAPVGPIGILCINRTLTKGFLSGIITGIGTSVGDAIYACIIGFGLTAVSNYLISHSTIIHIVGGLILCYMGLKILLPKKTNSIEINTNESGDFLSALILTVTNPMTIILFIAVFSGFGVGTTHPNIFSAIEIISGVFLGSLIWWAILSFAVAILRQKINKTVTKWIDVMSGLIILGFGVWIIF